MNRLITLVWQLLDDDHGFVVSAELIAVSTIAVLGMIVGLSEVGHAISQETEDVASGFGGLNQTFSVATSHSQGACLDGSSYDGAAFTDHPDFCDNDCDIVANWSINGEGGGTTGGDTTGGGTTGGGMNGGGMGGGMGGMMGGGAD